MDNAVKYCGLACLGASTSARTEADGTITYEVRDNGRGIDAKDRGTHL